MVGVTGFSTPELIASPTDSPGQGAAKSRSGESDNPQTEIDTFLVAKGDRSILLRSLIGTRFVVIEDADSYAALTRLGSRSSHSLLLIACESLDDSGDLIVREFKGQEGGGKVVVLMDLLGSQTLARAFKPYVDGFVPISTSRAALINYLSLAMLGEKFIAGECLSLLRATIRLWDSAANPSQAPTAEADPTHGLTLQQIQVLICLTKGLTDQEIADRLGIAEATVRFHNRACWPKINVKNRTQAALWAVRNLNLD